MLKEIRFQNWKSFKQATLYIDQLTVLIGTNASGKSNAVEALAFLRRVASGKNIQTALVGDSSLPALRGGLEWTARKPENQFTLAVLVEGLQKNSDYLYSLTIRTHHVAKIEAESLTCIQYDELEPEHHILFKTHPQSRDEDSSDLTYLFKVIYGMASEREQLENISTVSNVKAMMDGAKAVILSLENILILEPIPDKMRTYTPLSTQLNHDAQNLAGVLAALPNPQKREIEKILSTYAKQLPERELRRVWAETVGRLNSDAMLYCEEEWVEGEITLIDARTMSEGTLRFLAIVTALLTRPEGSQLVIEEVDTGLHPSRIGLLLEILKKQGEQRKIDILITTHNPALLDNLGPEMVPYVEVAHRDSETGASQLTLLEDISHLPKLLASGTLGKITMQGKLEKSLKTVL
ncbi:MAG TPA: ATPase [Thiotrichaceae bacterium]|nr:ATPase [Thiotrichaceae bacterium]